MTEKKKPIITITNVVSTCTISGFAVDMVDMILKKIPGSMYRPNGFPATVILLKHTRINLYDSGKVTSTKSSTSQKSIQSLYDFVDQLNGIEINCKMTSMPKISMITAIAEYPGSVIDMNGLRNNPNYTKDIQSFPAIELSFSGISVKAYETKLVISAKSIDSMIPVIQEIEKYTRQCDV